MIVLRLVRVFVIFSLWAGPFFFMPSQVYAGLPIWCCPCGTECSWLNLGSWFCECRGRSPGCPYCQKNDPTMFKAKSFTENDMSDMESVPESLSSTVTNSDLAASMVGQMRGGKCASNKFSLRLLASAVDGLKIERATISENSIRDQILVFHTPTEK